jgi:hypothetical protein
MCSLHVISTSCAQDIVIDETFYSIAPPPPSPILSIHLPLPSIPDASAPPTNAAPHVPVRKPHTTRTMVNLPIVRDPPKRKREECMEWIDWTLAEE